MGILITPILSLLRAYLEDLGGLGCAMNPIKGFCFRVQGLELRV